MATCAKCWRRGAKTLDSRQSHTDEGQPCLRRVTRCQRCGLRRQTLLDDGPTDKLYVAGRTERRHRPAGAGAVDSGRRSDG